MNVSLSVEDTMARWTPTIVLIVLAVGLYLGGLFFKNQATTIARYERENQANAERMKAHPEGISIAVDYGGASSAEYRSMAQMANIIAACLVVVAILSAIRATTGARAKVSNRSG